MIPESAATLPTINNDVLFSYGVMSMIPFRIVSDTFAPEKKQYNRNAYSLQCSLFTHQQFTAILYIAIIIKTAVHNSPMISSKKYHQCISGSIPDSIQRQDFNSYPHVLGPRISMMLTGIISSASRIQKSNMATGKLDVFRSQLVG